MKRSGSVFAGVLLLSAGVAYGQGEVVSFHGSGSGGTFIVPDPLDFDFVLTDIVFNHLLADTSYILAEVIDAQETPKVNVRSISQAGVASIWEYHFQSGIRFAGGSTIKVTSGSGTLTISGYYVTGGTVPTVGEWGLVVMVVLLMTAATVIFARRRAVAA